MLVTMLTLLEHPMINVDIVLFTKMLKNVEIEFGKKRGDS
jgi:hypothetical protein